MAKKQTTPRIIFHQQICTLTIIYLTRQPIGCEYLRSEPWTEGGVFMSTYEEFMVLLTFGILLVTILEYANHKK